MAERRGQVAAEQLADEGGRPPARPLDAIDRDILRILQQDGRASIRSVSDRVHVSRANAYARINRLIEDGVIRGFSARVDHERVEPGIFRVHHSQDRPELLAHGPPAAHRAAGHRAHRAGQR